MSPEENKEERKPSPEPAEGKKTRRTATELKVDIPNIERILDLKVIVNANIGVLKMNIKEILDLSLGSIIEIPVKSDASLPHTISSMHKQVAIGEVITIGENIGLRILET